MFICVQAVREVCVEIHILLKLKVSEGVNVLVTKITNKRNKCLKPRKICLQLKLFPDERV